MSPRRSRPGKTEAAPKTADQAVTASVRACPDCAEKVNPGRHIKHHDTCPLWTGLVTAFVDDELQLSWLPIGASRSRPTTPAERSELAMMGHPNPDPKVTVTRVSSGRHLARFEPSGLTMLLAVTS